MKCPLCHAESKEPNGYGEFVNMRAIQSAREQEYRKQLFSDEKIDRISSAICNIIGLANQDGRYDVLYQEGLIKEILKEELK